MIIKGQDIILNLENVIYLRKYTKHPKGEYDDDTQFLIGASTIHAEWITLFRFSSEEQRDDKFKEISSLID